MCKKVMAMVGVDVTLVYTKSHAPGQEGCWALSVQCVIYPYKVYVTSHCTGLDSVSQ